MTENQKPIVNTESETLLDEAKVARYLSENPEFFLHHEDLLAQMKIKNKAPEGVISFADRQIKVLREGHNKSKVHLQELTDIAKENESHWNKLKKLCIMMLEQKLNFQQNPELLLNWLKQNYNLSSVVARLPEHILNQVEHNKTSYEYKNLEIKKEVMLRIQSGYSYCDNRLPQDLKQEFFAENSLQVGSCAIIPLNVDRKNNEEQRDLEKGVIILSDQSTERFHNHVDMTYLNSLGEVISATLIP